MKLCPIPSVLLCRLGARLRPPTLKGGGVSPGESTGKPCRLHTVLEELAGVGKLGEQSRSVQDEDPLIQQTVLKNVFIFRWISLVSLLNID